jgi:hypothetical protein
LSTLAKQIFLKLAFFYTNFLRPFGGERAALKLGFGECWV